jgi:hypothetical protein
MNSKRIRTKTEIASQLSTLEPLLEEKLVSALEESSPVEQMELIEWLATGTAEDRSELEVPSLIKHLTPLQQRELIEWIKASMPEDVETDIRLHYQSK